jgi:flagellar P-ring protein precursor FlgI
MNPQLYQHLLYQRLLSITLLGMLFAWAVICSPLPTADAQGLRLRHICRLKGQESNTLQGLGLVVGLRGTGDSDSANTSRALARMMQLMGGQIGVDAQGRLDPSELADAKNVATVIVSAEVPPVGAQQGDKLDLVVNAISAKSLEGGYLVLTPLLGPQANNPTVYAMASGPLKISANGPATTATIERGGKMERTVQAPFEKDGKITLVIDRDFADFDTSQRVVETVRADPQIMMENRQSPGNPAAQKQYARAIDQLHVEVLIPDTYRADPISFISSLLDAPIALESKSNRVVINESAGIVLIGENVEIAPVLVASKNIRIEAGGGPPGLLPLDPTAPAQTGNPKLKALADSLNALGMSAEDLIDIIKELKAKGDLYGEVIIN